MVDLHHHLLPGLDDGSKDLETSVAMARIAVEDGISHIVCTPHASREWAFRPDINAERLETLRAALRAASVQITLGLGCDFHLSYDNIRDAQANPRKYTINQTEYLLVELPDHGIPLSMRETLHELRVAKMTPILTHPERNPSLQRNPKVLADWMRQGLLVQVTAGSVLGHMGKVAEQMARKLLDDRWVHFIATDAHNTETRPPKMRAACELIAKRHGAEYADRICGANPWAVFQGEPLPQQEDPLGLFEDDEPKPWWKKILGK